MNPRGSKAGWRIEKQVIGFIIGGGGALIIDLAVFNLLYLTGVSASFSNLLAVIAALVFNFFVNLLTFSQKPLGGGILHIVKRYALVSGASVLYVYVVFEAFIFLASGSDEVLMTLVRIGLFSSATVARFFLYRKWVF